MKYVSLPNGGTSKAPQMSMFIIAWSRVLNIKPEMSNFDVEIRFTAIEVHKESQISINNSHYPKLNHKSPFLQLEPSCYSHEQKISSQVCGSNHKDTYIVLDVEL